MIALLLRAVLSSIRRSAPAPNLTWAMSSDGLTMTGTSDIALTAATLTPSQFTTGTSTHAKPAAASAAGSTVTITFTTNQRVTAYELPKLTYVAGASPILSSVGTPAANFSNTAVTNTANTFLSTAVLDWDPMDSASYTKNGSNDLTAITNRVTGSASGALSGATPNWQATAWSGKPGLDIASGETIRIAAANMETAVVNAGAGGNARSVFAAVVAATALGEKALFGWGVNSGSTNRCFVGQGPAGQRKRELLTANTTNIRTNSAADVDANPDVWAFTLGSNLATIKQNSDAADPLNASHTPAASTPTRYFVGSSDFGATSNLWVGVLGRLIVCSTRLTGTPLQEVIDYVAACGAI